MSVLNETVFPSRDPAVNDSISPASSFPARPPRPFSPTPDPDLVFLHSRYEEVRGRTWHGLTRSPGCVLVTGEVGTGKTTLLRDLARRIPDSDPSAVILNSGLSADELLLAILEDLGMADSSELLRLGIEKNEIPLLSRLTPFLRRGRDVWILIDEAQHLDAESLVTITNILREAKSFAAPLHIGLFAQPEFESALERSPGAELKAFFTATAFLTPLDPDETKDYIHHRLHKIWPRTPVVLDPGALKRIHAFSEGIPRIINLLCEEILGALTTEPNEIHITEQRVRETIEQYNALNPPSRKRASSAHLLLGSVAALLLLLLLLPHSKPNAIIEGAASGSSPVPPPLARASVLSSEIEREIETLSPLRRVLEAEGVPTSKADDKRSLEEIAARTRLTLIRARVPFKTFRKLGIPAFLPPENPFFATREPALLLSGDEKQWTFDLSHHGRIVLRAPHRPLPLAFLLQPRPYLGRTKKKGMKGEDIRAVQEILFTQGLLLAEPNGYFGPETLDAVISLQKQYGLKPDGIVGPLTQLALYSLESGR
ncbi:MAG: hypothetical protein D6679_03060 [Candidatus Hydrogenedentota bacterium]|nr:MAG: hypothetical protein D6679_03060 [Candidatus Hydrogenedentota bacterium]